MLGREKEKKKPTQLWCAFLIFRFFCGCRLKVLFPLCILTWPPCCCRKDWTRGLVYRKATQSSTASPKMHICGIPLDVKKCLSLCRVFIRHPNITFCFMSTVFEPSCLRMLTVDSEALKLSGETKAGVAAARALAGQKVAAQAVNKPHQCGCPSMCFNMNAFFMPSLPLEDLVVTLF